MDVGGNLLDKAKEQGRNKEFGVRLQQSMSLPAFKQLGEGSHHRPGNSHGLFFAFIGRGKELLQEHLLGKVGDRIPEAVLPDDTKTFFDGEVRAEAYENSGSKAFFYFFVKGEDQVVLVLK